MLGLVLALGSVSFAGLLAMLRGDKGASAAALAGALGRATTPRDRETLQQELQQLRQALALVKRGKYCAPLACKTLRRDGRKGSCATTFGRKRDAAALLLEANPKLLEWLEGLGEPNYRAWVARGRKGPKPFPGQRETGLDAFDVRWDLRGRNRVGTWQEALYRTLPSSRRWRDLPERLAFFENALLDAGFPATVHAPQALLQLLIADQAVESCQQNVPKPATLQRRIVSLRKRKSRLPSAAVPF